MKAVKVIVQYEQAKYDLSDICCFCKGFINERDYFVKSISGKTAHYGCGKEAGWRKRPKQIKARTAKKPEQKTARAIKIMRNGRLVK